MKVYLIGCDVINKIGIAQNPEMRAQMLDSPKLPFPVKVLAVYEAGREAFTVEKALHKKFAAKRLRGEWFLGISPSIFIKHAKAEHSKCAPAPPATPKPKRDPRLAWLEEKAIGERIAVFIDNLERNSKC